MLKNLIISLITVILLGYNVIAQTYTLNSNLGTITTCNGTFVDQGGTGGNYSSSSNYTVTFCSGSTSHVKLIFTVLNVESGFDHLKFYDGANTSATLIDDATGNIGAFTIQSTGSCLTINFTSDIMTTTAGWVATISCVVPCTPPTAAGTFTNQTTPVLVCKNEVVNFSGAASTAASGFSISNYTWDFDDGTTGMGVTTSHSYSTPGQYTVNLDVVDNNGCHNTNRIDLDVQVGTKPKFTGTTPNQTVCPGQNVCLNGVVVPTPWQDIPSTIVSGATALPDGTSVCYENALTFTEFASWQTITNASQIQNIYASLEHTFVGDLTITIICPNGYQAGLFNSDGTFCTTNITSENFGNPTVTPSTGLLYTWTSTGTTIDAWGATSIATTIPSGTYGSEEPYTNLVGCPLNGTWTLKVCDTHSSDDGTIFYWGINFDPSVYSTLPGFTPTFNANSTDTYWTGTNAASTAAITSTSANADQICITPPISGVYSYRYTAVDNFGCTYDTTITVTATAAPSSAFTVTSPVCVGAPSTIHYTGDGIATDTYTWNWAGGTVVSGTGTTGYNDHTISWTSEGSYTVTLTSTRGTCTTTATMPVTVVQPPTSSFTINPNPLCLGSNATIHYTGNGTVSDNYSWNWNGGTVVSWSGAGDYQVTWPAPPTTHTVTLTVTSASVGTCSTTATASLAVQSCACIVDAGTNDQICGLTYGQLQGSTTAGDLTHVWTATGPGTVTFSPNANNPNAIPTVSLPGSYTFTWTITNQYGTVCSDNAIIKFTQIPTTTFTTTPINCYGQSSTLTYTGNATNTAIYNWNFGGATTVAPGGTVRGPHTVSWASEGANTVSLSVTEDGCTSTINTSVTLITPSDLVTSVTPGTIACATGSAANVTINASGGTPVYIYAWSNIIGPPFSSGAYFVTITDTKGCADVIPFSIVAPNAIVITPNQINLSCYNDNSGAASVIAAGGAGDFHYVWNAGGASAGDVPNVSSLPSGPISVSVTDLNGCLSVQNFNITQPTVVIANILNPVTNALCFGDCNGGATVIASGGTPGSNPNYTYNWSSGGSTSTMTGSLCAGLQTVTVYDGNNCPATATTTITAPAVLQANANIVQNISCFGYCDGKANVTVTGGTAPYSYNWSQGGINTPNATLLCAGTHTVTVTDSHGCTTTTQITINQPDALTAFISNPTPTSCFGTCDGTATTVSNVSGGTPPYSYFWTSNGGTQALGTGLCAGIQTVNITDFNGCPISASTTIIEPTVVTATITANENITCAEFCDGKATVTAGGGTPPFNYVWSVAQVNNTIYSVSNLCEGINYVTVNDNNGCSKTTYVVIDSPEQLNINIANYTNLLCFGDCNGNINTSTTGGTLPYNYVWSTSGIVGANATNLCKGTYVVTVTDDNGCYDIISQNLIEPEIITVGLGIPKDISCFGASDGKIIISAFGGTPPLKYSITTTSGVIFNTVGNFTGLAAGSYTITVTDHNGCSKLSNNITINEPSQIVIVSENHTNILCHGGIDGAINILANGGTGAITYSTLSNTNLTGEFTGLPANIYTIIFTDENECSIDTVIPITEPDELTVSITNITNVCIGSTVNLVATPVGGTPSYTYLWSVGGTTSQGITLNPTTSTTVTVSIEDDNHCPATATESFFVYPPLSLYLTAGDDSICPGEPITIIMHPSGGNGGPYVFTMDGQTFTSIDTTFYPTQTTTYTVSVKDGCETPSAIASIKITVLPIPPLQFNSDIDKGCRPLTVQFNESSPNTGQTYSWDFGDLFSSSGNSELKSPLHTFDYAGVYDISLTVTSLEGCVSTYTYNNMITVYPSPVAGFEPVPSIVSILEPIIYFNNYSQGAASYKWEFGDGDVLTQQHPSNPLHEYDSVGIFNVMLVAITEHQCRDTVYQGVKVIDVYTFYAPTAFSPDKDNTNDFFNVYGNGIDPKNFNLKIYDRWGELIYETNKYIVNELNKPTEGWTGTIKGKESGKTGTYSWICTYRDKQGLEHQEAGLVTLIR